MSKPIPKLKNGKPALVKELGGSPRGLVPAQGAQDIPYNTYLAELDPRGESERSKNLRRALSLSTDPRFNEFIVKLGEPYYRRWTLAGIAKSCDITLPQFADWWQKAQNQRVVAIAQEGMADLAKDMLADAASESIPCDRCDGFGWVYMEDGIPSEHVPQAIDQIGERQIRACPMCKGSGERKKPGDQHARDKILDLAGFGKKSHSGLTINQNFGGMAIESAVDRMSQITFDIEPVEAAAEDSSIIDSETDEAES